MEALSLERLDELMKSLDARTRSNHDSIRQAREKQGVQSEGLVRIEGRLGEQANDIAEMKTDMKWIKRGLFGAIAVGLMFTVAVATLVVQVAT